MKQVIGEPGHPLSSFAPSFEDEAAQLVVVDRSTLEVFALCPAQARLRPLANTNSHIAAAGTEVHNALSEAISSYIASGGVIRTGDLANEVGVNLRGSRPDVQPEAIRGMRASIWAWSEYLNKLHPENILRYDGGEGSRSGQLAWDLESLCLRITSEIDLLHSTRAPELLCEVDYKSGWKLRSAADVGDAFQFQLHAWLILQNYPDIKAVQITVWNTRKNARTWPVEFKRSDFPALNARVLSAAGAFWQYRDTSPDKAPTWPTVEKCSICPAAALCPESGADALDLNRDPGRYVDELVALEAKVAARYKLLSTYVSRTGQDVVSPAGNAFGTAARLSKYKPTNTTYEVKPEQESEVQA